MAEPRYAEYFEDLEKQAHAARFGMWIFLATEVLLFAGLFALYTVYRMKFPGAFAEGVQHNTKLLGTLNTGVLLTSSFAVAGAVRAVKDARPRLAGWLIMAGLALAAGFLFIKGYEYREHFHEGIWPGGRGHFFTEHPAPGMPLFWTLYFLMTGLHAVHVFAGMCTLTWMLWAVNAGRVDARAHHPAQIAALYWHLVDAVWIFLWPMFYLMKGG